MPTLTTTAPALVGAGPLFEERHWEDGSVIVRCVYQAVTTIDGVEYAHFKAFRWSADCEALCDAINLRGTINLDHWVAVEPYDREDAEAYNLREEYEDGRPRSY